MKFFHIADLHIGKNVNGFSMLEDQEYIFKQILRRIDEEKPDAVLVAGDVYDKGVPPTEAIQLWDYFLEKTADKGVRVFAISGNHDNAIRFGEHAAFTEAGGVILSQDYSGAIGPYIGEDEFGPVNIYLLPFIHPRKVRQHHPEAEINSYTEACKVAVDAMGINKAERNVLIAHQFITGGAICDSEESSVGGLDNVSGEVFDDFDYVALGHLHGPQHIKRKELRYSGTPLKYSLSEKNHKKSITVVELKEKGTVKIDEIPLEPLRDMVEYRGSFDEIMDKSFYEKINTKDYIHFILTDEDEIPDLMGRLKTVYPNAFKPTYDNKRTKEMREIDRAEDVEKKNPLELLEELYELQNNQPMNEEQRKLVAKCLEEVKGEKNETD